MLAKTEQSGYSNLILDGALKTSELSEADKRFASVLYYGTVERILTLDYIINKYSSKAVDKLDCDVRNILREAVFQLVYMNSVPDNAAVNEAVNLTKAVRKSSASGYVNAVLRSFIRDGKVIKYPKGRTERMSIEYSCPEWLINQLLDEHGEEKTESLLKRSVGACRTYIRVNTLKTSADELMVLLKGHGITAERSAYDENCLSVSGTGAVETLDEFCKGLFHVQDLSSQLCARALDAKENDVVLDVCSAPGGKAFTIAENMNDKGTVYAFDLHQKRVGLIASGAERLGITCINAMAQDSTVHNESIPMADKILCDVPCSGLGVIGRKAEIKYKPKESLERLPEVQYSILDASSAYLKKGGTLIYSTCSVSNAENSEVIQKFLLNHTDFEPVPLLLPDCGEDVCEKTIFPLDYDSDGFYIAKLRKVR